jgi:hypothetical protein
MARLNFPKFSKETLYVLPLLVLLATDELFHPFMFRFNGRYEGFALNYVGIVSTFVKIAGGVAVVFVILNIRKFRDTTLIISTLALLYLIIMVFESVYLYNNLIQYPHVILKLFNLFIALAIFAFYANRPSLNIHLLMSFIILGLLMQIYFQPKMLSLQAFVAHDRGLHARSIFLLCLPCIFYFNEYLTTLKLATLLKFLFLLIVILLANHRTVWAVILFSLLINVFIVRKNINFKLGKVLSSLILVLIMAGFIFSITISYSPEVENKILTNINNILNPQEDRTGSWRIDQMQSYWPMVENNFMVGMRWKGFELPVQFYNTDVGNAIFDDNTGHHFHSFYFDTLFYFGISGLILFMLALLLPVFTVLKYNLVLNNTQLSFLIFSLGGLLYGLAYNLPFSYWLIFGITVAQIKSAFNSNVSRTE